jgi:hypothetical protein
MSSVQRAASKDFWSTPYYTQLLFHSIARLFQILSMSVEIFVRSSKTVAFALKPHGNLFPTY